MTIIEARPVTLADKAAVRQMLEESSPHSLYTRFFSAVPVVQDRLVQQLVDVDHDCVEAVVALEDGQVVGLASYHREECSDTAEIAVIVSDAHQRSGIASTMFRHLTKLALAHGVTRFTAIVLPGNDAAMGLSRSMNEHARARFDGGEMRIDIPLTPPGGSAVEALGDHWSRGVE